MSWYITEQEPVYADYNSTTPLNDQVEQEIIKALKTWANPASSTVLGAEAKKCVELGRARLGQLLNVGPEEVTFTSGGTEANNWVINYAQYVLKDNSALPHYIASTIEHDSIIEPLKNLEASGNIELSLIPVDHATGQVIVEHVERSIKSNTCFVTLMLANNETGVLQPVSEVADVVRRAAERLGHKIIFHSDAAQAIGKIPCDINKMKADFITVVGHKFYGPRIGALIRRNHLTTELKPFLFGGGQERGLRSGTENTPMIAGLGKAASFAAENIDSISAHLADIRDYFEGELEKHLPGAHVIHFKDSPRLPNTSSVAFPSYADSSAQLLQQCKSFYASTGAACHSDGTIVSPVLIACGIRPEVAERTVRFSFGRSNTKEEVDRIVKELKSMVFLAKYGSSLLNALGKGAIPGF